ncbi:TIGR03905 family TSCPD domain-containing protein [Desulfitobacterium sp. AusDCA]
MSAFLTEISIISLLFSINAWRIYFNATGRINFTFSGKVIIIFNRKQNIHLEGTDSMKTFITKGVCSSRITFETENNILTHVKFTGGCPGNLKAIAALVEGMPVDEVIKRLKGISCGGKPTSCADQLAKALQQNK